jgi:amidophosphoribosyltransferase
MYGVSVYEARLTMGEKSADKIRRSYPDTYDEIDVIIPIPDTARTCAFQVVYCPNKPFREGFIKNWYTFIMPGQAN